MVAAGRAVEQREIATVELYDSVTSVLAGLGRRGLFEVQLAY
jgi:hypothetical protein